MRAKAKLFPSPPESCWEGCSCYSIGLGRALPLLLFHWPWDAWVLTAPLPSLVTGPQLQRLLLEQSCHAPSCPEASSLSATAASSSTPSEQPAVGFSPLLQRGANLALSLHHLLLLQLRLLGLCDFFCLLRLLGHEVSWIHSVPSLSFQVPPCSARPAQWLPSAFP